jgi:hypothetical protein
LMATLPKYRLVALEASLLRQFPGIAGAYMVGRTSDWSSKLMSPCA